MPPLLDWGTVTTVKEGDIAGPAGGLSTSSSTNENDLAVLGVSQYATDRMEGGTDKPWRKSGIFGDVHGNIYDSSGYDGIDGGMHWEPTMGLEGTPAGSPVAWWFAMGGILIAIKVLAEKSGEEAEFKTIRIGATNIMIITLSAVVGLTLLKWVFGIYKVPGISQIIEAA